ncbi:MAG TPA: thioether cross-link-forming SCIFF peptide maturase [Clostridia bacterium]|nr:thioether cross-link-forming SCIFF peptide maturase [Clostridia bacterium]
MIHKYKLNGYNIVLDVYSNSLHIVDDIAYDIISIYKEKSTEDIINTILEMHPEITKDDILECLSDISQLEKENKLFSEDTYANIPIRKRSNSNIVKALCLHVAHTCNLNCEYCFASQGNYKGKRALMSYEVGKQALDFLINHSGTRRNLEVDFFGGEPLMNLDVCKQLVKYARSIEKEHNKNFRFTLTTNGVLIDDDVIKFANEQMDNVVLSLDGRKCVHDRLRKDIKGNGSYDLIVPKFQKLVSNRTKGTYYVRGTFTHFNTDFTNDILHMADLGFTELSMEPVVCPPEDVYALTKEDLPIILEQYEILAKEMLNREKQGKEFVFYHYMIDLTHGPCIYKRLSGCGSGTEYLAVTPWGELFPCHQFVSDSNYSMGDVWKGVTNISLQKEFGMCNAYSREECKDCWAKLYCSGGCAANAYHASGSILGTYEYGCELFKKRMECAIMLQIARQDIKLAD